MKPYFLLDGECEDCGETIRNWDGKATKCNACDIISSLKPYDDDISDEEQFDEDIEYNLDNITAYLNEFD